MRIIKSGSREDKKARFVCKNCHCEFECGKDEFWMNESTTSLTYPISYECFANCPQCHYICKTYKTKQNTVITGTSEEITDEYNQQI